MKLTPLILGMFILAGGTCGLVLGRALTGGSFTSQGDLHNPKAAPRPIASRGELDSDEKQTIEIFKRVAPSVVYITKFGLRRNFFMSDPMTVAEGSGSGFVWSEDGYVVTNRHVVGELSPGSTWQV